MQVQALGASAGVMCKVQVQGNHIFSEMRDEIGIIRIVNTVSMLMLVVMASCCLRHSDGTNGR